MEERDYLENLWDNYMLAVDKYAEKQFYLKIKPWLLENNLRFLSGMGTYWIGKNIKNSQQMLEDDEIPEDIRDILEEEILGMPANTLGTIMPDYRWKE